MTWVTDRDCGLRSNAGMKADPLPFRLETLMNANVGTLDRVLRVVVGIALIALTLTGQIGVWGYIGVVPLLTGLFRFCPLYGVLGLNTCGLRR